MAPESPPTTMESPSVDAAGTVAFARDAVDRWLRGYFALAALLFAFGGAVGGAVVVATPTGTFEAIGSGAASPFPETFSAPVILRTNLLAAGIALLGVLSFGTLSALSALFNGYLLGSIVAAVVTAGGSLRFLAAAVLPHGVIELPALWIVSAIGIRTGVRTVRYLLGDDGAAISRTEALEAAWLVVVAALGLVVAAYVEVHLTPALVDAVGGVP